MSAVPPIAAERVRGSRELDGSSISLMSTSTMTTFMINSSVRTTQTLVLVSHKYHPWHSSRVNAYTCPHSGMGIGFNLGLAKPSLRGRSKKSATAIYPRPAHRMPTYLSRSLTTVGQSSMASPFSVGKAIFTSGIGSRITHGEAANFLLTKSCRTPLLLVVAWQTVHSRPVHPSRFHLTNREFLSFYTYFGCVSSYQ